ncbi:MAG: ferrous iron transport protein B [Gammaproteobacteria bacterium]|nr:ferrous iron transport protein B [Gammaproteobacteria bacterium]
MKRLALLGMPNTGKSTFFNRLTGAGARTGNWPGVTVDLLAAKVLLGGDMVEVVDLPGVYNLDGYGDDERVVREFLGANPVDGLAIITDATQLDRQLILALQAKSFGLPGVLLVNMSDEARSLGIEIDLPALERQLGLSVVLLSARNGEGMPAARQSLTSMLHDSQVQGAVSPEAADPDLADKAYQLWSDTVTVPTTLNDTLTTRLDRIMLHRWFGLPLFFLIMLGVFQAVYTLGAPLQDLVASALDWGRGQVLEPLVTLLPGPVASFILDGLYDGIGTVASFLPVILLFFIFMSLVEGSGYLSRAAYLTDMIMARAGLDGRSFVMQLMGFGCNVPALMGTRIMGARGLRLLTMLIIPFSLCSARLQVFVFLVTALFSPRAAPLVLFSLYLFSFGTAFLTAMLFKRGLTHKEPFLLELPPYRLPVLRVVTMRAWHEVSHFLKKATLFIIAGVVLVWFLTHYPFDAEPASMETLAGTLSIWMEPLFSPLGIDRLMSITLLFGFVAKEVVLGAMAVIYSSGDAGLAAAVSGQMNWIQAYSFMLFVLVYTPCLSTIAVMQQESRDWRYTTIAVVWPLTLAWVMSLVFYQVATYFWG